MRVDASKQAASLRVDDFAGEIALARETAAMAATAKTECRALVVMEKAVAPAPKVYRQAPFLAHLIATKEHAPQTRERRRAEPAEAIGVYRSVAALVTA